MARQDSPRFGALLKTLRTTAGLTQEALAERARLSVRGLQDLERGQSRRPRRDTVELLAAALDLSGWSRTTFLAEAHARPLGPRLPTAPAPPQLFSARVLVPLVGRTRELALLERFVTAEAEPPGSAPVLLLAGEPGMGKTRLLQAAAQRAIAQGWCVLAGGCQRRGGQEPYAPVLDALAQHLYAAEPAHQRAALAGCAWLVRLLPELAPVLEPLPAASLPPEQERRLLFAAVARFLTNVAGSAGTLLVLDDLQWAGTDALDLLATLLRAGTPALRVVGAYRNTEVGPTDPLGLLLADMAQARLVRHHALDPLAPDEAEELLADLLGGAAAGTAGERATRARVLARAGGTPFYLVSYAQALRAAGAGQDTGVDAVPWDVGQGVRRRVALLPPAGQELLGAAAIVGRRASRRLLVAVAGQAEEAVPAGLEAACRARLLQEDGDDAYAFAHDLIREVVEADLGTARRALLHRKVAETLEGEPAEATPETLAYHYDRAGNPDKAVRYLELAGDYAWTQRAHAAADGQYRAVLDRLDGLGRTQDAVRVREKLGEVLIWAGRYDAALRVLESAAETYMLAEDQDSQGRVAARMGEAHALRGSPNAGIALLRSVLERLHRSGALPSLAAVHLKLGLLLFTAGRYGECLSATDRVIDLARASGDTRTLVLAMLNRGNILKLLGRIEDALRMDHEVLILAETVGDLKCLVSAHRDLASIHALRGDFAIGKRHINQSFALAEPMGNPANLSCTLAFRGWLAALAGDARAAHADLDQALALRDQTDRSWYLPYVLTFWARVALAEGDRAATAAALGEATALAEESSDLQVLRWAATTMAELDILEGRPDAARTRLLPLLDQPGLEETDVTVLLPVLAWAQLELREVGLAADLVEQALTRARPEKMRLILVEALRVRALIALRRQQWDEAAASLEEGLELARSMPYPYAEARLLQVAGMLHAQRGEPAARECLESARAIFAPLSARKDAEHMEHALAALSQKQTIGVLRLTDAQWAAVAALLPPRRQGRGRPRADDRRTLEAILYVRRTGCAWADLPSVLGDEATAHRRWQQWRAEGLWERIVAIVGTTPAAAVEPSAAPRRED